MWHYHTVVCMSTQGTLTQKIKIYFHKTEKIADICSLARGCVGVIDSKVEKEKEIITLTLTVHGCTEQSLAQNIQYALGYVHGIKKALIRK